LNSVVHHVEKQAEEKGREISDTKLIDVNYTPFAIPAYFEL
jgi:hypothetical protein